MKKIVTLAKFNIESLVAVRSLQCEDHALHNVPNVLTVVWNLGKRCNYDCSYCSPHVHDLVSPFVNLQDSLNFINVINTEVQKSNKKIKWAFTGGEPFVDPNFLTILDYLNNLSTTYQVNSISNGSLPLETYVKSLEYLNGVTISLHLERRDKEILDTIKKICELEKLGKGFINVNVMFLPGKMEQVKHIINILETHSVRYVIRRITPQVAVGDELSPYVGSKKKAVLKDIHKQKNTKFDYKLKNDVDSQQVTYYNNEELAFIESRHKTSWQNCGLWDIDYNYQELNTDDLVSKDLHSFTNWICYAGVDSIFVDFDGSIYRGLCLNGKEIGHIRDQSKIFQENPTICGLQRCFCNTDIAIRKCKSINELPLIT